MYVIGAVADGPVKLGISADPARRLKKLQTGHQQRLHLVHSEAVLAEKARLYERLLHRDVGYKRSHGEWFHLTVEEAIAHIACTFMDYDLVENLADKVRRHLI